MISLVFGLVVVLQGIWTEDLPPFIHVCQRSDPDIENCIIQTMEEIRPHLVTGVPEYNIPSVEPLFIKELIREQSSGLTLTTSDVVAYGGGNFIVISSKIDFDTLTFTADVELPELKVEAKYSVEGRVMVLQVKGRGSFYANLNCKSHGVFQGELYQKDGNEHLRFVSSSMKVNIGKGLVRVETGRGNVLNDLINDALNRNLKGFLKELMPFVERALGAKFLEIANTIVEPFTYEQLFPK